MNLQTIKSIDGKVEYILLPVATYYALRHHITDFYALHKGEVYWFYHMHGNTSARKDV
jgi:hypothetical protein